MSRRQSAAGGLVQSHLRGKRGIQAKVENNTHVVLTGCDKMLIGLTADKIRGVKPPEPYQGKGIRYTNEHIIRKAGKAAAGAK